MDTKRSTAKSVGEESRGRAVELLYRYETRKVGHTHFGADNSSFIRMNDHHLSLELDFFKVIRRTPSGAWIDYRHRSGLKIKEKFVKTTASKPWAEPTPEEALSSFITRKRWHIRMLEQQLNDAKQSLNLAEKKSRRDSRWIAYWRTK